MSPANPAKSIFDADTAHELRQLVGDQTDWFISEDGHGPVEVNSAEFDFSYAHGRLLFSCWTERGSRVWSINGWNLSGDKLVLQASRRLGAEHSTIELVPRASAKALVAGIAVARQARCDRVAELVSR